MRFPNQIQAALTKFGQAKILILKLMPNKGKWTESTVEITIFCVPNSQHHFMEKAMLGVIDFLARTYLCAKARKAWNILKKNNPTFEKEW